MSEPIEPALSAEEWEAVKVRGEVLVCDEEDLELGLCQHCVAILSDEELKESAFAAMPNARLSTENCDPGMTDVLLLGVTVEDPSTPSMVALPNDLARLIALANFVLPDTDPRKITWAMIDILRREAKSIGNPIGSDSDDYSPYLSPSIREARMVAIADALQSYLPPR